MTAELRAFILERCVGSSHHWQLRTLALFALSCTTLPETESYSYGAAGASGAGITAGAGASSGSSATTGGSAGAGGTSGGGGGMVGTGGNMTSGTGGGSGSTASAGAGNGAGGSSGSGTGTGGAGAAGKGGTGGGGESGAGPGGTSGKGGTAGGAGTGGTSGKGGTAGGAGAGGTSGKGGGAGAGAGSGGSGGGLVELAEGQPATADSEEQNPMNPAPRGNDGDDSTRWCANDGAPHFWTVDLGDSHVLSRIEIDFEYPPQAVGFAYGYVVSISADDDTYTTAVDESTNMNTVNTQVASFPMSTSARYVRITVTPPDTTEMGAPTWASFWEVRIYGQ